MIFGKLKEKSNKKAIVIALIVLLVIMGIGYANLQTDLIISEAVEVKKPVEAIELSFDNTASSSSCTTAQCMIDYIDSLLD